jgi:hypothetical protein
MNYSKNSPYFTSRQVLVSSVQTKQQLQEIQWDDRVHYSSKGVSGNRKNLLRVSSNPAVSRRMFSWHVDSDLISVDAANTKQQNRRSFLIHPE